MAGVNKAPAILYFDVLSDDAEEAAVEGDVGACQLAACGRRQIHAESAYFDGIGDAVGRELFLHGYEILGIVHLVEVRMYRAQHETVHADAFIAHDQREIPAENIYTGFGGIV